MRRVTRQRGFTLIELMMASTVTFLLAIVCVSLIQQSADLRAGAEARLELNAQARQTFGLLGDGGAVALGSAGTDGSRSIYGLRQSYSAPAGTSLRQNYRLTLPSNGLQAEGDSLPTVTVTCKGVADPLPDCTAVGQQKTVAGWLGADPGLDTSRTVRNAVMGNRATTVETSATLTHPYRALKSRRPAEATDRYRNIFTMNREMP